MSAPDYAAKYEQFAVLDRRDGVLTVRFTTDGGSMEWSGAAHRYMPLMFDDIGNDFDNEVVILTGTGESFISGLDFGSHDSLSPQYLARMFHQGRRMLHSLLDIDVPLIAAVNGPVRVHAELAALCDIVLATPETVFQDASHALVGLVPGDGVHVVWPALLGPNRGRYFLLTGEELPAEEAKRLGVVAEVVPGDLLVKRAQELADRLMQAPAPLRRYSAVPIRARLRKIMSEDLEVGMAIAGIGALEHWPTGRTGFEPTAR